MPIKYSWTFREAAENADPSTALRSAQDDKFRLCCSRVVQRFAQDDKPSAA
jgi:hypothetical protein